MNITDTLASGFTLLLFVFLVVTMYDQVNVEAFQQYKSAIFVGSMFLFLAILGIPYMEYDVAHRVPSGTLAGYGLGILAVAGALCVYVFNMQVDTFIAYISTGVIAATIFGKLGGGREGGPEFPAFAKEMLQFLVAGGVLYGSYAGAKIAVERGIPENPTLRGALITLVGIAPIGLWGMLAYVVYRTIKGLLDYRNTSSKQSCSSKSPKIVQGIPRYEGFQEQDQGQDLIAQLEAAIDRTQTTLETLVEQTDSTCAIIKEVEQGYVGAKSGPEDAAEYELPEDEQQRRKQSRQERALKAFATQRKIYAATRNTKPLECFMDATEYEIAVRELCIQLHNLLENAETLKEIQKVQQMEVDLDFADRQLTRVEMFQNAPTPIPTQIYSTLREDALTKAAQALLQKELNLYNSVVQIQQKIKDVRGRMSKAYTKVNMVATGDYKFN